MERAARWIVLIACAATVAQYLVIVAGTLGHPFQLEWMEGGMLDVAARLRAGEPLYAAPTVDYVPHVYPPLYFAAVAGASTVTGLDLIAGRLVSLFAFLGTCALVFRLVQRETSQWWLGAATVGLLVATYELTGRWFHLARLDSLYLLLLVAGFYALRFGEGRRSAALAGGLFALAFFTKQTALFAVPPMLVALAFTDGRRAAWTALWFGGAALLGSLALAALTDGWFLYYVFSLPAQHALVPLEATRYVGSEMVAALPALAATIGAVVWLMRRERDRGIPYLGFALGMLGSSWIAFSHEGAYLNALLPASVALAVLPCIAMGRLWERGALLATAALVGQLLLLTHATAASLPDEGAEVSGEAFLAWVAAREGEVLLPDHRFLQTRVGKRSHGLGMAARDVLRADRDDPGRRMLEESLAHALTERRFSTVVLSQEDWLDSVVALAYEPAGTIDLAPEPVTGFPWRPTWVWVRPEPTAEGAGEAGND